MWLITILKSVRFCQPKIVGKTERWQKRIQGSTLSVWLLAIYVHEYLVYSSISLLVLLYEM